MIILYIYILYCMVVSVTLGFMLYAFVRVKVFKKDRLIWLIFLLKKGGCLCMCSCSHVHIYVYLHIYKHASLHLNTYFH